MSRWEGGGEGVGGRTGGGGREGGRMGRRWEGGRY